MSLPHALLTSLAEHPCSGMELARRFDRSIGHFWHATHQQIYRELARLEAAGWVQSGPAESGRGRQRAYRILAAGRKELKRWVAAGGDGAPLRDELMVRLRAEAVVGPTGLDREVRARLQAHQDQLALYQGMQAKSFAGRELSRAQALQHLVLSAGIRYETSWIETLQQALQVLAMPVERG
jgi:DNA-binding PadR family transcriptional regulator